LEVVGTVKADTVLIDTTTRYFSIPVGAFVANADNKFWTRTHEYVYMRSGTGYFSAPVHLPDGANIKSLMVTFWSDTTVSLQGHLYRQDLNSGTSFSYISAYSSGTSASVRTMEQAYGAGSFIVDNENYAYYVRVYIPAWYDSKQRLYAARVKYTITSPLP
jgi:hypothetical protein